MTNDVHPVFKPLLDSISPRKPQHTQGPWNYDGEFIRAETEKDGQVTIATVRGWEQAWRDEEFANARLIAAAPELLSDAKQKLVVMKELLAYIKAWNPDDVRTASLQLEIGASEKLIKKATGAA